MNSEMVQIQFRVKLRNNPRVEIGKIFLILLVTNLLKAKVHKTKQIQASIAIHLTISRWDKSEVVYKRECFSMNQFIKP